MSKLDAFVLAAAAVLVLVLSVVGEKDASLQKAIDCMTKSDEELRKGMRDVQLTSWDKETTDPTDETNKKKEEADNKFSKLTRKLNSEVRKHKWQDFKSKNYTLWRWFKTFFDEFNSTDDGKAQKKVVEMSGHFSTARLCKYNSSECNLCLEPDVAELHESSKDAGKRLHYWKEVRDKIGRKIRKSFVESLVPLNETAKRDGFTDRGDFLRKKYETNGFATEMKKVVDNFIENVYKLLHAYVRRKLINYYKEKSPDVHIQKDGLIPAHLIGDLYSQTWLSSFDIVNPYKDLLPNTTKNMLAQGLNQKKMFEMAETFFTSMGMKKMTSSFWKKSIIEKPKGVKNFVCHGSAHDFADGEDFRIKLCTQVTFRDLTTVHHEVGHVEYFMYYNKQPFLFREAANPGFHEAIGDTIVLSVSTPNYLKKRGLSSKNMKADDHNVDMSYLLFMAFQFGTRIPYSFIVDEYRYRIFSGKIDVSKLNSAWWDLRSQYQGLCPGIERTEEDFDPGCKFHIAHDIEYMRYFYSAVLQFQLHKALCWHAGHKGPLHKCNIYENKAAGKAYGDFLSYGKSINFAEQLKKLGVSPAKLDAGALIEYFEPLVKWLKEETKNEYIGWKTGKNSMSCQ